MAGFIKICGLRDAAAVDAALQSGADALGFVFAPSVRRVTPAQAAELAEPARGRVPCIAVMLQQWMRPCSLVLMRWVLYLRRRCVVSHLHRLLRWPRLHAVVCLASP